MKKILLYTLFLLGEGLLIFSFLHFSSESENYSTTINITVSSIIYFLFFIDALVPMVDLSDISHPKVGSSGIRWIVTYLYAVSAIGLMLVFNTIFLIGAQSQILLHAILLFLAAAGLSVAVASASKVKSDYESEQTRRARMLNIKDVSKEILHTINSRNDIEPKIKGQIFDLSEDLRYLSPTNNSDAHKAEEKILKELKTLESVLQKSPIELTKEIIHAMQTCALYYQERKNIYSI
ncbi:MAG: hypothetical protein GY790_04415 [Bacteroidetes bacterium]|nr:hypothetical protein [Bacteroidota bacterium]